VDNGAVDDERAMFDERSDAAAAATEPVPAETAPQSATPSKFFESAVDGREHGDQLQRKKAILGSYTRWEIKKVRKLTSLKIADTKVSEF
jgi:hypothetical protein